MDETTWRTTKTERTWMLEHVRSPVWARQLRLFGCACARRVWSLLSEPAREAVETMERLLPPERARREPGLGVNTPAALAEHANRILAASPPSPVVLALLEHGYRGSVHAATRALAAMPRDAWRSELAAQCDLVRCIFGNPFRPARLTLAWLEANRGVVRDLARVIHDEARFADLPILADALEDAGCTDGQVLEHCRAPGPHGRGCWLLDLLLGAR